MTLSQSFKERVVYVVNSHYSCNNVDLHSIKSSKSIELANTIPLFLKEIQTWALSMTGHSIFIKRSIHTFVLSVFLVCFCLKILQHILLIHEQWTTHTDSIVTHSWTKVLQHAYFLPKACTFLCLIRDIGQHFSAVLGAILNNEITRKIHTNVKNVANK